MKDIDNSLPSAEDLTGQKMVETGPPIYDIPQPPEWLIFDRFIVNTAHIRYISYDEKGIVIVYGNDMQDRCFPVPNVKKTWEALQIIFGGIKDEPKAI